MTAQKKCMDCKHSGMDMDMQPYCAHPEVCKRMPYGQILASLASPTRDGNECGPDRRLWEQRS